MLRRELRVVVPQNAEAILVAVETYLQHQATASVVSVLLLLFFSAIAFRMLEQAVEAIFHRSSGDRRRHVLVSAVLPYAFMLLLVAGLFLVTLATSALDALLKDKAKLTRVLTDHVVPGKVMAADVLRLKDGAKVKTVEGHEFTLGLKGGKVMVDAALVTATDVAASNGVIHVIDSVIMPKD